MAVVTATIDFGSTPAEGGSFTVTDPLLAGATYVEGFFMGSDTTADNDAPAHELMALSAKVSCQAASGNNVAVEIILLIGMVTGTFKIRLATS